MLDQAYRAEQEGKIFCRYCPSVLSNKDSLRNHRLRYKGRVGDAVASNNDLYGYKKKRNQKSAVKAAVVSGARDMGESPTSNLKESLFLEMLEDSSDLPSFTQWNRTMQ